MANEFQFEKKFESNRSKFKIVFCFISKIGNTSTLN